jgi:putative membrane protein
MRLIQTRRSAREACLAGEACRPGRNVVKATVLFSQRVARRMQQKAAIYALRATAAAPYRYLPVRAKLPPAGTQVANGVLMSKRRNCIFWSSTLLLGALGCGGSSPASQSPASATQTPNSDEAGSTSVSDGTNASTSSGSGSPAAESPDSTARAATDAAERSLGSNTEATPGTQRAPLTDPQIAAVTDSVNSAEIAQAQIAQARSKNERVRRFAAMMIEHHSQAKAQQAALGLGSAESPLLQQLTQESHATLESLKAKSGADFDRAYMEAQVEGHQKALDTIKYDLQPSAQTPELRSYLENLTPKVTQHLEQARDAQQALQTSDNSSRATGTTSSR